MVEEKDNVAKIAKGVTKVNSAGQKIEERWLTVTGKDLKDVAKEFDKRWEE